MKKSECLMILRSMVCGASSKEHEAVAFVEKKFKELKKLKRQNHGCDHCKYDSYGCEHICKYCSQIYRNMFEKRA